MLFFKQNGCRFSNCLNLNMFYRFYTVLNFMNDTHQNYTSLLRSFFSHRPVYVICLLTLILLSF